MSLTVKCVEAGLVDACCYLIKDNATGLAAVIDCGAYSADVSRMLRESHIERLEYIMLTHGHFDHILGVPELKRNYGGEIIIHERDAGMLSDSVLNLACAFMLNNTESFEPDRTVHENDEIILGETVLRVLHTPGHTEGSSSFVTDGAVFSGDTLFHGSIGRTDFPGGSMKSILTSITKIAALPGGSALYPGHGEASTIEEERKTNGYLRNRI